MKRVRLGVVGCGAHSVLYQLPAFRRCPDLDLVAVVDREAAWARKVAAKFNVPNAYSDHRALVGQVDAALVATPNSTHREITESLLEAGVHVLCEKPIATTTQDVRSMFEVAARRNTRLMAAHCLRFSPAFSMLKHVIDAGWLGEIESFEAALGGSYASGARRTDFRRQRGMSGGGVLMDLGVHVIDLSLWLLGSEPTDVSYHCTVADGWEVETDADVLLRFPGGARAMLSCSFTRSLANSVAVPGSDGWASVPVYGPTELTVFSRKARVCRRDGTQQLLVPPDSMFERQAAHFCRALQVGDPFLVTRRQVEAGLDVIERCYEGEVVRA